MRYFGSVHYNLTEQQQKAAFKQFDSESLPKLQVIAQNQANDACVTHGQLITFTPQATTQQTRSVHPCSTTQPIPITSSANVHTAPIPYKEQLRQIQKTNEYAKVACSIPAALQDLANLIADNKTEVAQAQGHSIPNLIAQIAYQGLLDISQGKAVGNLEKLQPAQHAMAIASAGLYIAAANEANKGNNSYANELLEYAKYGIACCNAFIENASYEAIRPLHEKYLNYRYPYCDWHSYLDKVDQELAAGKGKLYQQCAQAGKLVGPHIPNILISLISHKATGPGSTGPKPSYALATVGGATVTVASQEVVATGVISTARIGATEILMSSGPDGMEGGEKIPEPKGSQNLKIPVRVADDAMVLAIEAEKAASTSMAENQAAKTGAKVEGTTVRSRRGCSSS